MVLEDHPPPGTSNNTYSTWKVDRATPISLGLSEPRYPKPPFAEWVAIYFHYGVINGCFNEMMSQIFTWEMVVHLQPSPM